MAEAERGRSRRLAFGSGRTVRTDRRLTLPRSSLAVVLALAIGAVSLAAVEFSSVVLAQDAVFTDQYLNDPKIIALGREVWQTRCTYCHGRRSYPGKAPKLKPSRYTPELVYDRVTNGFGKMPAWKDEFSEEERRAVVAYVLSNVFSP